MIRLERELSLPVEVKKEKLERKELLENIFSNKDGMTAESIKKNITYTPGRKIFNYFILFNDSTGMASALYFIPTSIFVYTLWLPPVCFILTIGAAFLFSYSLYLDIEENEKANQAKIDEYKNRVEYSIYHQEGWLSLISSHYESEGKGLLINSEDHTLRVVDESLLTQSNLFKAWEKEYFRSFIDLSQPAQPTRFSKQKIILLMRTNLTCASTMYTLVKLTLPYIAAGLGVNITAPILGISLVLIVVFYSLPLAIAQFHYNERDEKYINELENLKSQAFEISKKRTDTLLSISSRLFPSTQNNPFFPTNQTTASISHVDLVADNTEHRVFPL